MFGLWHSLASLQPSVTQVLGHPIFFLVPLGIHVADIHAYLPE